MDNEKISELFQDTTFIEKVLEAATEEEVKEMFLKKGVELKEGEIDLLAKEIEKNAFESGILSEQELTDVSGGISNLGAVGIGAGGAIVGAAAMVPVAGWAFKKGVDYANSWWTYCTNKGEKSPTSSKPKP